jgi:glycerophosphoryl diester phosphodiesterase
MKLLIILVILMQTQLTLAKKPLCVSHRGLGHGGLENSMQAFKNAINAGATTIEFDILHTLDNETIVYHDEVFERLIQGESCFLKKKVQDLKLINIRKNCVLNNQEKVPLFSEAMKLFGESGINIFIEMKDTKMTEDDFNIIKNNYKENPEKVFIISFEPKALDKIIERRKSDPYFNKVRIILVKRWGDFANIKNYDGLDARFIHGPTIRKYQKQGKIVGVYTKDSVTSFKRYISRGVDFITTNVSPLCEEIINQEN